MTPPRDRGPDGRPRNARPRDPMTGQPLPREADGMSPDDPPAMTPAEALGEAQELLRTGHAFRAHEVLESVWKSEVDDRDLWRGLAQLAVGVTHAQRGNPQGARAVLARAALTLQPWSGQQPHAVDVDRLRAWAATLANDDDIASADLQPPPLVTGEDG